MKGEERSRRVFHPFLLEEDVDRELKSHLELTVEALVAEGWTPEEARTEALRRFGDTSRIARECSEISREQVRDVRRGIMIESFLQDLKYALRGLRKSPGFTLVAILTLALGIGANATVFSLVDGVILEPLPFENPEEIVWVAEVTQSGSENWPAWPNFQDWRTENRSFQALSAYNSWHSNILGGTAPTYTRVAHVSQDFWKVFPLVPSTGRLTLEEDHRQGGAPVAVVSGSFASEALGGRDSLGRMIEIGETRYEVVGVVPAAFDFPSGSQVWVPAEQQTLSMSRSSHNHHVVGRLRPGFTPEEATLELDPMTRRLVAEELAEWGPDYLAAGAVVRSLRAQLVGDTDRLLLLLLGAAAFVLLVACTNLASTLLARGTTRSAEMAVRSAVGASRGRIVRQLLLESLLLAVLGGAAGLGMAHLSLKVIGITGIDSLPRLENVGIDGTVLVFVLVATAVTALVFGLFPALQAGDGDQARVLRTEGRGQEGYRGKTWGALVATEVALAMVLLTGSGLLIRSFATILAEDGGFDASDVAMASVAISQIKYVGEEAHVQYWDELLRRTGATPGVSAAGVMSVHPAGEFVPNGRVELNGDPTDFGDADYIVTSGGALEALDVTLLQGRLFEERDGPESPHVAVVSRSFAERYWPGQDPIGKLVSGGGMDRFWREDPPIFGTVVGVVSDVRYRALTRPGRPTVYWHYRQRPGRISYGGNLLVEAGGDEPDAIVGSLRGVLADTDPDVPIRIRALEDSVAGSLAGRRFTLLAMGAFAFIALFLATLGIYGVVSYAVARRTREMGVRIALGATGGTVRGMVMKGAMVPVILGLGVGMAAALGLSRIMTGLLYEVSATDPASFLGMGALLLVTALVATAIPAWRGTRVDPMVTMRGE